MPSSTKQQKYPNITNVKETQAVQGGMSHARSELFCHVQQCNAVCLRVGLAFNQDSNLLSFYKVDYACWQVIRHSGCIKGVACSLSLTH